MRHPAEPRRAFASAPHTAYCWVMAGYVIDWQAWATFATGVMAVGAAFAVASRQNAITRRLAESADHQTEILARQVRLEQIKLRNELFDRRFKIYQAVAEFLRQIVQEAAEPSKDAQLDFIIAMRESVFILSPKVAAKIDKIWIIANKLFFVKRESERLYKTQGHYGKFPHKEYRLMIWLSTRLIKLPAMFDSDLNLWHPEGD